MEKPSSPAPALGSETDLRAEIARLKDALHTDQTGLALAMQDIYKIAESYAWVVNSRGPYVWDDPEYRKEMGRMVKEMQDRCLKALNESGDRAHAHCCGRKSQNNQL